MPLWRSANGGWIAENPHQQEQSEKEGQGIEGPEYITECQEDWGEDRKSVD